MIIYDASTKTTKKMDIGEYFRWLRRHATSIRIFNRRVGGYKPYVEMYKDGEIVGRHSVQVSDDEAYVFDLRLSKPGRGGYIRLSGRGRGR